MSRDEQDVQNETLEELRGIVNTTKNVRENTEET